LLPFSATICCRFWKQFVAENGNTTKLYCPHWKQIVAENGNKLLRKTATNRQQIVADLWCGQALTDS